MRTTLRLGVAMLAALSSCTPTLSHTRADRDIFDDIAPRYLNYLNNDASLDPQDRATFARTVRVWELKVVNAEKAAGVEPKPRITGGN